MSEIIGPADRPPRLRLRLYVSGATARSRRAIRNARLLCEGRVAGGYELQVIDVHQQPELAREHNLIALPTLVRVAPLPECRFIGDLSDTERVEAGLELGPAADPVYGD